MITQVLMAPGRGEFRLDPSVARGVVENLEAFSLIVVTAGRMANPDASELLQASRWTGILRDRSEKGTVIGGPSIMAWMGDDDEKGPEVTETIDGTTSGLAMIQDLVSPNSNLNGLYEGDLSSLPGTTVWASKTATETSRQFLDRLHVALGWHYRVRPNLLLDVGETAEDLFRTDEVFISPRAPLFDLALRMVRGEVTVSATDEDFATRITVIDGGYSGSATGLVAINNARFASGGEFWRRIFGNDLGSNAACAALAARELLGQFSSKRRIEVSIEMDDPAAFIEPGDTVLVWDQIAGVRNSANEINAPGGVAYPLSASVSEMTWPVGPGKALYVIQNSDASVVDLTDVFVPETGMTKLAVGIRWPFLEEVVNGRTYTT